MSEVDHIADVGKLIERLKYYGHPACAGYVPPQDIIREAAAALQSQAHRVEELEGALRKAEGWFRDYERQHRAKRTSEGNLKADTNQERADFLGSVLSEGEKGS